MQLFEHKEDERVVELLSDLHILRMESPEYFSKFAIECIENLNNPHKLNKMEIRILENIRMFAFDQNNFNEYRRQNG